MAKIGRIDSLNPLVSGGTVIGYQHVSMGHFQHGLVWTLLAIIPVAGLVFSLTPRFTQDQFYSGYCKVVPRLKGGERIVDVGCGDGKLLNR